LCAALPAVSVRDGFTPPPEPRTIGAIAIARDSLLSLLGFQQLAQPHALAGTTSRPQRQRSRPRSRQPHVTCGAGRLELADRSAGNFARRTFPILWDDLLSARTVDRLSSLPPLRRYGWALVSPLRPHLTQRARLTTTLRTTGFAIKVRSFLADALPDGQKKAAAGRTTAHAELIASAGITAERWLAGDSDACSINCGFAARPG